MNAWLPENLNDGNPGPAIIIVNHASFWVFFSFLFWQDKDVIQEMWHDILSSSSSSFPLALKEHTLAIIKRREKSYTDTQYTCNFLQHFFPNDHACGLLDTNWTLLSFTLSCGSPGVWGWSCSDDNAHRAPLRVSFHCAFPCIQLLLIYLPQRHYCCIHVFRKHCLKWCPSTYSFSGGNSV